jgi:hypothetical protein
VDIDLGLELVGDTRRASRSSWDAVQRAVDRTVQLTGIPANVAEEIDRWGMITLLDYKRSSRLYRRWGALEVRLLDPTNWSIGKLTRYLDSDVRDVMKVFRTRKVSAATATRTWGRALRASPASTTQFQFRRNVEEFLARHGRGTWGAVFDAPRWTRAFHRAAQIRVPAGPRS